MIAHSSSDLRAADLEHLPGVLSRNFLGDGPLCAELRELLRARFDCAHVVLTHSATAALRLGLIALREQAPTRTRILIGGYVCPAVISAIRQAGLLPLFADIAEGSLRIDFAGSRTRIDSTVLAVVCTSAGGVPDPYDAAESLGVPVISDCAQAVGTRLGGSDLATRGCCAVLSFGSTKVITAGSGGALLVRSEPLGRRLVELAREELPDARYAGGEFPVTWGQQLGELLAGLVRSQLSRLEEGLESRRSIADRYDTALEGWGTHRLVREAPGERFNRFRYYFLSAQAEAWVAHLRSCGVDARRSISHAMGTLYGDPAQLPQLVRWSDRVVSVPIYPRLSEAEVARIVAGLESGPSA